MGVSVRTNQRSSKEGTDEWDRLGLLGCPVHSRAETGRMDGNDDPGASGPIEANEDAFAIPFFEQGFR
jgi:hypothetical protein